MKIGVDIGGMSAKIGLVNKDNKIVGRKVVKTENGLAADAMIAKIVDGIRELMNDYELSTDDIDGIGIGCPGMLDRKKGVVVYSNNLAWENVPIIALIKKEIDTAIDVANDADVAALGEVYAGAAKGYDNAVLITLGTGVGGGVILDKKIFSGSVNGGCEIGHTVLEYGGVQCTCGRKGCFEVYSSSTALMRMAREAADENHESMLYKLCEGDLEKMNGKIPFDAAAAGDETGKMVIECYEDYLAAGIANVINVFRPEVVILGGGVSAQKKVLTVPVQEKVNGLCYGGSRSEIAQIVVSELGNDAGIIGAANLI